MGSFLSLCRSGVETFLNLKIFLVTAIDLDIGFRASLGIFNHIKVLKLEGWVALKHRTLNGFMDQNEAVLLGLHDYLRDGGIIGNFPEYGDQFYYKDQEFVLDTSYSEEIKREQYMPCTYIRGLHPHIALFQF